MQSRGYPSESSAHGSGDESKTQNDRDMLRRKHDIRQEPLPKGNTFPTSFNEAKKIVCSLDLLHVRYHVCVNDCIIYRHEYAESTECPKCGVSRYKKTKKAPKKWCGIFRSLLVCSVISRTLSKLSSCVGMQKGSNKKKKMKKMIQIKTSS